MNHDAENEARHGHTRLQRCAGPPFHVEARACEWGWFHHVTSTCLPIYPGSFPDSVACGLFVYPLSWWIVVVGYNERGCDLGHRWSQQSLSCSDTYANMSLCVCAPIRYIYLYISFGASAVHVYTHFRSPKCIYTRLHTDAFIFMHNISRHPFWLDALMHLFGPGSTKHQAFYARPT